MTEILRDLSYFWSVIASSKMFPEDFEYGNQIT